MPWLNYHAHSLFCDGKAAPEEFVLAALDKCFPAWGFSSHAPVPFPSPWNMPADRMDAYLAEIGRLRSAYAGRIEIYTGLEVDYLGNGRGYTVETLRAAGIDFVIGSVHYVGTYGDGRGFCFDGQPADFFRGVEELYGNDFRAVISCYFERVRQMLEDDRPDVVGHFDKIKMHSTVRPYIHEEDPLYQKEVEKSLDLMAETGCILEVNTRGLYKHNPPLLYPSAEIIKSAFRRNIPVMMNSDSHHPSEIESGFSETAALLRQIGYRSLRVLLNGTWQDRGFSPAGIDV